MRKLLFIPLFLMLITLPVQAQSANIQLSPVRANYTAQPGQTVHALIDIKNPKNTPITVQVVANDFTADPNGSGEPRLLLDKRSTDYGISNWLTDSNINKTLTIPANQTISYDAVFKVPFGVAERTYFGAVRFAPTTSNSSEEITASVGSLVFITVGAPKTKLSISELDYGESDDAQNRFGEFRVTVKNESEGLSTPSFVLKITDDSGTTVEEIHQEASGSVLPQSMRKFTLAPTKELPSKQLTITIQAADQLGTTADKTIQLDRSPPEVATTSNPESKESSFPWLLLIPAILVILATVIEVLAAHHRKKQPTQPTEPSNLSEAQLNENYTNQN